MPRIKWSLPAYSDLARLHAFLEPMSRDVANRAIRTIQQGVKPLGKHPEMGRLIEDMSPDVREWVIEFGQRSYVARYQYDGKQVIIMAIRHGREDGF